MTTEPATYPHCDPRILHAPGECEFCDMHPDWQADRTYLDVAFTGHEPGPGQQPCPADEARPPGSSADHRRWGGNKPSRIEDHSAWPPETSASRMLYGDPEHRTRPPNTFQPDVANRRSWWRRVLDRRG